MLIRLYLQIAGLFFVIITITGCTFLLPDETFYGTYENEPERKFLRKLAEEGEVEAQYRLAMSYCCGVGSYYNNEQALNWFCEAAKREHTGSQFEVGRFYDNSHDVRGWDMVTYSRKEAAGPYPERDIIRAYMWYYIAADKGHTNAGLFLRKLEKELSPQQIDQAMVMIRNWREVPCGTSVMPWGDEVKIR